MTRREPTASDVRWDVSLIGFGLPSDPRTFSGYAFNLMRGLSADGHLRREFSAKNMRVADAFGAALRLDRLLPRPKLSISRRWMWSARGSRILSERLNAQIEASGDRGAFLEVGTLVKVDPRFGPHYQLTDMTIAQARRAGHFAIGRLSPKEMDEAENAKAAVTEARANAAAKKLDTPYQCRSLPEALDKIGSEWAKTTRTEVLKACYVELGLVILTSDTSDAKYVCPYKISEVQKAAATHGLAEAYPELGAALAKLPKTCLKK